MLILLMARLFSSTSRMCGGRPLLGGLHALSRPSDAETGIGCCGPQREASSLSPHMHVPFTGARSRVQTVHNPWSDAIMLFAVAAGLKARKLTDVCNRVEIPLSSRWLQSQKCLNQQS
jgi:hypothetical protein